MSFLIRMVCILAVTTLPLLAQQFVYQGSLPGPIVWSEAVEVIDANGDGQLDVIFTNGQGFSSAQGSRAPTLLINQGAAGSIVFADEADILHGSAHPDRDYNLLIRPGKSRLGLHYVRNRSLVLDLRLMCLTLIAAGAPEWTRTSVVRTLRRTGADEELVGIARRDQPLVASLPPGVTEDAWERHL